MELTVDNIQEVSMQDLVESYVKASAVIEESEAQRSVVREEILLRMKYDSETVDGYTITKVKKYKFNVTLDEAKELGAIKTVVDESILKGLYLKGVPIKDVKFIIYPLIKAMKEE